MSTRQAGRQEWRNVSKASCWDGYASCRGCWIQLEKSPNNVRALNFVFEDEATGISTVKTTADKMDGEWYDLSGRRVAQPAKGIYVKNGKKVIVK